MALFLILQLLCSWQFINLHFGLELECAHFLPKKNLTLYNKVHQFKW